jgi:dolichol-phosphate mannosyltransferase
MGAAGPEISVVLPAHNEAGNISAIAAAIAQAMALQVPYEIVFVDDGSTDGTLAAIRAAARDPAIRYVSFTRNFGHQAALRAGLRHARGRGVIVMDADFEHPPELIPKLIAAWQGGAKIVATQRADDAGCLDGKAALSRLYYKAARRDRRRAHRAGQRRLHAARPPVGGRRDQRPRGQDIFLRGLVRWLGFPLVTIPYARGSAPTARASSRSAAWWSSRSPASPRTACAVALRDLARARFRGARLAVRDLRDRELPVRAAHGRGLVLDRWR